MRPIPNTRIERYRITGGPLASDSTFGNNGRFLIPSPATRATLSVQASDGLGWEHVSVSLRVRCPTWEEMNFVKGLFWDDEEAVMQLHPPRSTWVNCHPYCLHLWKPALVDQLSIPLPPAILVGPVTG